MLYILTCSGLSCLRVSLTGCSAAWGGMTTLTNEKTVLRVLTNEKTVLRVLSNEKPEYNYLTPDLLAPVLAPPLASTRKLTRKSVFWGPRSLGGEDLIMGPQIVTLGMLWPPNVWSNTWLLVLLLWKIISMILQSRVNCSEQEKKDNIKRKNILSCGSNEWWIPPTLLTK